MGAVFWVSYVLLWLLVLVLGVLVVLLYQQLGSRLTEAHPDRPQDTGPAREGLPPGTPLPPVALAWDGAATPSRWAPAADARPTNGGGESSTDRRAGGWLLLLTAPGCPTCQAVHDHGAELAAGWPDHTFVWVRRGPADPAAAANPAAALEASTAAALNADDPAAAPGTDPATALEAASEASPESETDGEGEREGAPAGWRLAVDPGGAAAVALEAPATPFAYAVRADGTVAAGSRVRGPDDIHALLTSASGAQPAGPGTPASKQRPTNGLPAARSAGT